jgi:predicted transcriptional regulator
MTANKLTATHTQILRILIYNSSDDWKHINYVIKCLGYKNNLQGISSTYSCLTDLKNRYLIRLSKQLIDRPDDTRWQITDKGKKMLDSLESI